MPVVDHIQGPLAARLREQLGRRRLLGVGAKVGVGGPDLLPYKPGQMGSSYPLIREVAGLVPVGIAVQDGNSAYINPKTGKHVTIAEQIAFATEYLHADYIFWCTEEPYYSEQVIPFFNRTDE